MLPGPGRVRGEVGDPRTGWQAQERPKVLAHRPGRTRPGAGRGGSGPGPVELPFRGEAPGPRATETARSPGSTGALSPMADRTPGSGGHFAPREAAARAESQGLPPEPTAPALPGSFPTPREAAAEAPGRWHPRPALPGSSVLTQAAAGHHRLPGCRPPLPAVLRDLGAPGVGPSPSGRASALKMVR